MADHARKFELEFLSAGVSNNGQLLYTPGAKVIKDDGPSLLSMIQHAANLVSVPANSKPTVETHIEGAQHPVGRRTLRQLVCPRR
jgi:hypothetical protein